MLVEIFFAVAGLGLIVVLAGLGVSVWLMVYKEWKNK